MNLKLILLSAIIGLIGLSYAQNDALEQEVMETYADIVYASYQDSLTTATTLKEEVDAFLANPNEDTLQAAKDAWLAAQEPYGQTEAYRFYGGPIDDADGPEPLLNAWPLDEAYVDYVEGAPEAGIINSPDSYPTVDKELLISLNEAGAEENISTGYHAVEFLLWGQDLSAETAGQRPVSDYTTAEHAERRAAYLFAATDLLVEDLSMLVEAWKPDADNYRAEFLAMNPDEALTNIMTGIGVLAKSELAGERIFTAYDNQNQEDEHSCFSDNTHRDIITNLQGIENVYRGSYTRLDGSVVEGAGLEEVVAAANPELDAQMQTLLETSRAQAQNLPVPFDQAIVDEASRPQVLELVMTLLDTGDKVAEVSSTLGLTINTALPE